MSSIQEETYRTIGKNVKKYRLANNISQEKLSEIVSLLDTLNDLKDL